MAHNKMYRNFIILQEDEKTHAASGEKALSGYAKIEAKNDKCKISFYAQNLSIEERYSIVLICYKKDIKQIVDLGSLTIKDSGKGECSKEYYVNNIAGVNISYDKISGAAVCKYKEGKLDFLMYGFMNGEHVKDDWKKCKVIKHNEDEEEIVVVEKKETTKIEKKDDKKIETKKIKEVKEVEKKDKEEKIECKNIEDKHKEHKCKEKEESKEVEKCEACKEKEELKEVEKCEVCKEKHKDEFKCDVEKDKKSVLECSKCSHIEKNNDKNCDERSSIIADFDAYENRIEQEKEFEIDPYEFELRGGVGEFFKDISKDFEEVKNKYKDIKYCKWYKVKINNIDDMCDISNYNKYTVAYHPMINYYPYIKKYGYYMLGYKCDEKGEVKYLVYGIPGKKDRDEQPYMGKTGFVTWMKIDNRDNGCWLMFYDYKKSLVVVPAKG